MGLSTVNIGKTQTSTKSVGMAAHMLYETVNHAHNRYLYGKRVTDMPHIRRALLESWARIVMARLYCYRAVDYFRQANAQTDRRYLLFHPIQKARAAAECEKAVILMHNIMAAKAYETDMFAETAIRQIGNPVRLEGTVHVNMSQAVKFIHNYFYDTIDMPDVPDGKMVKDDSQSTFVQGFGGAKMIKFSDYRKAFAGCRLENVKIFLEQAEAFGAFSNTSPMTKDQEKNADFMLNIAEIFATVVYSQLVFEKAKIESIEDKIIDQLFSYLVRDINAYVMRQLNEYAGHFESGQKNGLSAIIKEPRIDFALENALLEEDILALEGAYH
jgi:acyl-CoA dehydrogenase